MTGSPNEFQTAQVASVLFVFAVDELATAFFGYRNMVNSEACSETAPLCTCKALLRKALSFFKVSCRAH
jgi:hypothetical protein